MTMRILILFIGLIVSVAQPGARAATIDTSAITDLKVKAAVEEINRRQAAITETSCTMVELIKVNDQIRKQENIRIDYRAPGLMLMTRITVGGPFNGQGSWILLGDRWMWKIDTRSPGQLSEDARRMKNAGKSQAEIEQEIAKRTATCTKIDLDKMREAGLFDTFMEPFMTFLLPENLPDASKWKLETESPVQWVFVTMTKKSQIRLIFEKKTGVCTYAEVKGGNQFARAVSPFVINPKPPIRDVTFKYEPPPGVAFKDITNEMMDIVNRRMQSPQNED